MSKEYKIYFGKRFYQDKKGYWVNCMPIHAQRWVWINHHGTIAAGMDVHHMDGDKGNNEIENLELVSRADHLKKHWAEGSFDLEQRRKQLSEARLWLKTPQGRKKQSCMAKVGWRKRRPIIKKCLGCDRDFETFQKWAKCCHENCYARWRRENQIGFIQKKCWICGNLYLKDKHSKIRTCGRECGSKLSILNRSQTVS